MSQVAESLRLGGTTHDWRVGTIAFCGVVQRPDLHTVGSFATSASQLKVREWCRLKSTDPSGWSPSVGNCRHAQESTFPQDHRGPSESCRTEGQSRKESQTKAYSGFEPSCRSDRERNDRRELATKFFLRLQQSYMNISRERRGCVVAIFSRGWLASLTSMRYCAGDSDWSHSEDINPNPPIIKALFGIPAPASFEETILARALSFSAPGIWPFSVVTVSELK